MTDSSSFYLGIDVAKAKLDVVLLCAQQQEHRVLANNEQGFEQLLDWLGERHAQAAQVCLEATGSYSDAIVRFLDAHDIALSVVGTEVLVGYRACKGQRSKTDKADAFLLACYAREAQPRRYRPLSEPVQQIRQMLSYRLDLQEMLGQERNRIEAGRMLPWMHEQAQRRITGLQKDLKEVEKRLRAVLQEQEEMAALCQRLQTIVGIGLIAAATLIGSIGEIERFEQVGSLVSFAGLAIKERQSGKSVKGRPQMDRHGREDVRRVLYWCAVTAMRCDADMKAWAQRLLARGKPKKVVILAVMRKLLHIVYGVWKRAEDYNPRLAFPSLAAEQEPLLSSAA